MSPSFGGTHGMPELQHSTPIPGCLSLPITASNTIMPQCQISKDSGCDETSPNTNK